MSRLVDIPLRLPTAAIEEIQAIAKLAGVAPNTVAKVMLAMYLRKQDLTTTPESN